MEENGFQQPVPRESPVSVGAHLIGRRKAVVPEVIVAHPQARGELLRLVQMQAYDRIQLYGGHRAEAQTDAAAEPKAVLDGDPVRLGLARLYVGGAVLPQGRSAGKAGEGEEEEEALHHGESRSEGPGSCTYRFQQGWASSQS